MNVKENFSLLRNVPNVLNLSSQKIKAFEIVNGSQKIYRVLELMEYKINHFTKPFVYAELDSKEKRSGISVINMPTYNLHVSYNIPTKQMVLNISPFGVTDIYPSDPDPMNIYASMVYAICFRNIVTKKYIPVPSQFAVIVNFLLTVFVRLFGKEYGLLGSFSNEIIRLKFLLSCYILQSFFDVSKKDSYIRSSVISTVKYTDFGERLDEFDFTKIEDFIKSLSVFGVLSGIDKYSFSSRILKLLSINFLPALEDLSRFLSVMVTSNITSSNIVPTFIHGYNDEEYNKIIKIAKLAFRK